MTLLIPALITLGALIPLGEPHGIAALVARRLGLSAQATRDLQSLFGGPSVDPVQQHDVGERRRHGAVGLRLADCAAEGLPARPGSCRRAGCVTSGARWCGSAVLRGGGGAGGGGRRCSRATHSCWRSCWSPSCSLWAWWTQHLLLGGRVGWRPLLRRRVAMTVGLYALAHRGPAVRCRPRSAYNFDRYGPDRHRLRAAVVVHRVRRRDARRGGGRGRAVGARHPGAGESGAGSPADGEPVDQEPGPEPDPLRAPAGRRRRRA